MTDNPISTSTPAPASVDIDGAKLRELRKLCGLTILDLAEDCGISFQHLSMVERGDRRVSAPVFARLCDKLGVTDRRQLLRKVAA